MRKGVFHETASRTQNIIQLSLVIEIISLGFLLFGGFSFYMLMKVKVNGPLYLKVVHGKDLIADILPPPEYIVETYLTAFEMEQDIENPEKTDMYARYIKQLHL